MTTKILPGMNRQALIIHNAGGVRDWLDGVAIDVSRIRSFLMSDTGGAWEKSEITVTSRMCSMEALKLYFLQHYLSVDYYMIFFVGHGYYDAERGPMYALPNGQRISGEWLKEQTRRVPTLLITDSCQCIEKFGDGGVLRESRTFSWISDSERRNEYRRAYDNALGGLPENMFVTASSVSPGEEAGENDAIGGYYIYSLVSVANDIASNGSSQSGIYGIGYAHHYAAEKVRKLSGERQTPLLEGYTRSHQPPFMIKL